MNQQSTFYWHDYETWGAVPRIDRAAQFAGIRTDFDFNIIGEPDMFYCKTPMDRLPHPQACLVTGLLPDNVDKHGLTETLFFDRINQAFSTRNTCVVGYNNIRFDDEVTRYGFYRNFIDPYAREWQNGNSRWDIIDMVRLTHALRPEGIEWPNYDDGTPCLRLEQLTIANNIQHQNAHDALSDVYATIAIAQLIKHKQPKLFNFVFQHRQKNRAKQLIYIGMDKPVLHISSMYSNRLGNIAPVIPLAVEPSNPNAILVYDLRHDPKQFENLSHDDIQHLLFSPKETLTRERLPVKSVHLNKCPIIVPMNTLTKDSAKKWDIDLSKIENHWQWITHHSDFLSALPSAYNNRTFDTNTDPDTALYDGFASNKDKHLIEQISLSTPEELKTIQPLFDDEKYNELLFRFRARNWPQTLNDKEKNDWKKHCHQLLNQDNTGQYLNFSQFETEISAILADPDASATNKQLMQQLQAWGIAFKSKING